MALAYHKNKVEGDNHIINDFVYDTLTELESAGSLTGSDVGKVAKVNESDFISYYILISSTGPIWGLISQQGYTSLQTTNATETTALSYTLNDESSYYIKATAVCQLDSAATDQAVIVTSGLFYRTSGGNATQESTSIDHDETTKSSGFTTVDLNLNTNSTDVDIEVTGVDATTINWKVWVEIKKVF